MPMKPAVYHRPNTIEEALLLLGKPDTKPLGGGAILLADGTSSGVVDLQDLGLDGLDSDEETLIAGAMTRLADLNRYVSESLPVDHPEKHEGMQSLLMSSIRRAGPNTYRNAATVGGLIASRLADSELLAALLVLNARITLLEPERRSIGISEYLFADVRPDGLITEVSIPRMKGESASERVARTPADYPIVSVTIFKPSSDDARLAVTGIDKRPARIVEAEQALASGVEVDEVARVVKGKACHPGDFRGDKSYRAEMAYVLTLRALKKLD